MASPIYWAAQDYNPHTAAAAIEQRRVGTGHLILIRHMQGLQKAETCPGSQTSPPPLERLEQAAVSVVDNTDTQTQIITAARRQDHATITQRQKLGQYESPHCEGRRRRRRRRWDCAAAAPQCEGRLWGGENMKRKSERRRGESRKKRCAAHRASEAGPNSDLYMEITGKRPCTNLSDVHGCTQRPVHAQYCFPNKRGCEKVWFLAGFVIIWRHLVSPSIVCVCESI